jgi:hypothetical protein
MAPSKDRKKFFLFDTPMSASGREDTLLGVAFETPTAGTLDGYTPQGPHTDKEEADNVPSMLENLKNIWNGGLSLGPAGPQDIPQTTATTETQADHTFGKYDYRSSCPWPKELVEKVYPNESTDAAGVQRIQQRIRDVSVRTRVLGAITQSLGFNEEALDTMIIPILRRHSTEDPWGMIRDLLHKTEYRERFINLCSKQSSSRKTLYVATGLIACEGVSYQRMLSDEKELGLAAGDPTHAVPVNIGGKLHYLKRSTVKGGYQSPIVLCMSYRKVEYQCIDNDSKPGLWGLLKGKSHAPDSSDGATWKFDREGGMQDVFWVPDHDQKGEIPAFMGPEDLLEDEQIGRSKTAILEDADFSDAVAGAEDSDDDH